MIIKPKAILENVLMGVLVIDAHGCIQYANSLVKQMLNCEIPIGSSLQTIEPSITNEVFSCIKKGKKKYTFNIKKQEETIEIIISLVKHDNVTKGALCFTRLLEEVEAEAWALPNIKAMKLQFEAVLDHSYYGIYILDGLGTVLKVNDVGADLIGIKKEEIIGISISKLVEKGIIDKPLTPSILKTKKPLIRPIYVKKSNKYILSSGLPILDKNGNIQFVVVIEHDMTIVKELRTQLEQAKQIAETIKSELSDRNLLKLKNNEIVADAPSMKQVLSILLKLSKMDASNILIIGESGTGKGYLTRFIHENGNRKNRPFISINCAALPEMLLEAELFGYEKGAFTGASDAGKAGLFELANQGIIFLDEIGDLPFPVQAKLLKCLDEGEIRRLGGTKAIKVNCIVIAATNRNLEKLVRKKKFRQDLYFRLNIFPIQIPPLRERSEDIHKLSMYYLKKYNERYGQKKYFSEKCSEELQTYDFPGNVRELKNMIKNSVVIKEENRLATILPKRRKKIKSRETSSFKVEKSVGKLGFNEELLKFERKKLIKAIDKFDSTRDLASYLRISQSTVVRKLKKHGLSID